MNQILKNILLVSGSGQNVGKTSFIRRIITLNAAQNIAAVKITPHFHEPTVGLIPIAMNENYRVFQETDPSLGKDSSLFLQAGAEKVFYIQTTDDFLREAFGIVMEKTSELQPIIVESAALRRILVPEIYLFIQKKFEDIKPTALEMQKLADLIVDSDSGQFSIDPAIITFNQTWIINIDDNS